MQKIFFVSSHKSFTKIFLIRFQRFEEINNMKNIAINGLGRIGKLVVRRLFDVGLGTNLTQLNDLNSDSEMLAHLLEFDTVHGKWQKA